MILDDDFLQNFVTQSAGPVSLERLKGVLEDEDNLAPGASIESRQMLAAVCDEVCAEARTVPKESRHEFLSSVLDMIGEALHEIGEVKISMVHAAVREARSAKADSHTCQELAAACEDRRLRLETKKSQVSELSERLSASKHDLSKAG